MTAAAIAFAFQLAGDLFGHRNQRAQREDGHAVVVAVLQQFGLADRDGAGNVLHRRAGTEAARIAHGDGAVPLHGGEQHVGQFVFVLGNHVHQVRDAAQIADVEKAVVRRAVVGGKAAAIHAEDHRQILQADIVHDGVEGALQERGVDGAERLEALGGQPGGEQDRMLLGDADIEIFVRMMRLEAVESRCRWAWRR